MECFADTLFLRIRERGFRARTISVSHVPQLQKDIETLRASSLLEKKFCEDRLAGFNFQVPEDLPNAQSLIVVAVPRPQTRAVFVWNGKRRQLIIPPTYTADEAVTRQVRDFLAEVLREEGYKSKETALPLKLLAARSGLGQYGRNNILYVNGFGSFLQLVAVYSDMPCEEDSWQERTMMKSCKECELCRRACPTGAISPDRFLLHAERCIVYHNEKMGDIPFPEWLETCWHNSIVGCMICQRVCPENREVIKWMEDEEEFSEEETTLIIKGVSREELPTATLRKLERLSLTDYFGSLPRNLGVFFKKVEQSRFTAS